MIRFVLDASAILTLIENEPGADRVDEILKSSSFLIPWIALLEVHYITLQELSEEQANRRYALLTQTGGSVSWEIDEPTMLVASHLKAEHRLSLADAITAAYAIRNDATLVHKDPEYAVLEGTMDLEALPYKS